MKKLKNLFIAVMSILVTLTGCSNATETIYDSIILENAAKVTAESGFNSDLNPFVDGSRFFTVTKNSNTEFSVDVNGTNMIIQIPAKPTSSVYQPTDITELSKNHDQIVTNSKELVAKYIDASDILKDKENIKNYINSLNAKEAFFTDDDSIGAYFSYEDDSLYINKNNSEFICEAMIVHELIHAISYYTHNCSIENEEYAFYLFNEILTDLITSSLNPKINNTIQSSYSLYYDLLYPYINLVGQNAIEAYFYGYDIIYEQINQEELDFFAIVIENYGAENSDVYYNNLLYKWYAK